MAGLFPTAEQTVAQATPQGQRGALIIITVLFFMWGLLTALNDVLIPHLRAIYTLSYVEAMLVQFCFFGAYFIVSVPAGALIRRIGYQRGVVAGLAVAAAGCALFYPASLSGFGMFLTAFFVLASGITLLQVAANPYVTALGDPASASGRLTLTQAFNALGTTVAPALGGMFILSNTTLTPAQLAQLAPAQAMAYRAQEAASVQGPYLALCAALLALAVFFGCARLPRIHDARHENAGTSSIFRQPRLLLGAIGIFLYVGGEVAIGSFLINFLGEPTIGGMDPSVAAPLVSYYWGGAMVGRFIGFAIMRHMSPGRILAFNAAASVCMILAAVLGQGPLAQWSLLAVGLCNSIMFPTIFSMALHRLGPATGQGSGLLCMAIVGGAIIPSLQGLLADRIGLQPSFLLPALCYLFVLFFGLKYAGLYRKGAE